MIIFNREFLFTIIFILANLHVLRNISLIFLAPYFFLIFFFTLSTFQFRLKINFNTRYFLLLSFFICQWLYVIVISAYSLNFIDLVNSTSRLLYSLLFFLSLLVNLYLFDNESFFERIIKIYLFFTSIASAFLIFQYFFGPIDFFHAHAGRGGLIRYSTSLGAITVYGVVVGLSIPLLLIIKSNVYRFLLLIIFILGALFSLQKAAVANIFLSIFFLFILYKASLTKKLLFLLIIIVVSSFIATIFFNDYLLVNLNIMGIGSGALFTGESLDTDLFRRLNGSYIPSIPPIQYFIGLGFIGGGGVYGVENGIMAHSQFFEMLLLGGPLFLLAYMFIIFIPLLKIYRVNSKYFSTKNISLIVFFIMFVINSFVFGGMLINPSISLIFYFILCYSYVAYFRSSTSPGIQVKSINK